MQNQEEFDNMIIITGCARSGTSMVAGIVSKCGAFGGKMTGPLPHNKKGQYENDYIRDRIEKPYLRSIGVDYLGQFPLAITEKLIIPNDWRKNVQDVFKREGYNGKTPVFYKGAKACQIWPVWNYAFPNAKWLIIRRRSADIVNSCLKTGFMQRFAEKRIQEKVGAKSEHEGWVWWVREHEQKFREMIEAGLNVKVIWTDRMIRGNYEQLHDAIEWLGLEWKQEEVIKHIAPVLWHGQKHINE